MSATMDHIKEDALFVVELVLATPITVRSALCWRKIETGARRLSI